MFTVRNCFTGRYFCESHKNTAKHIVHIEIEQQNLQLSNNISAFVLDGGTYGRQSVNIIEQSKMAMSAVAVATFTVPTCCCCYYHLGIV